MDWLIKIPLAHRGLHNNEGGTPENSMASFEAALDAGYPIELDLQLLDDGEIAVFHDSYLSRLTGQKGKISTKNSTNIKKYKLLGTNEKIPLLKEVLECVEGRVPMLIELKSKRNIGEFEQNFLRDISGYKGEFAVESFNPLSVRWFRDNAPHLLRGQLYGGLRGRRFFTKLSNPHFGVFDIRYIPINVLTIFRERNIPVLGYTVKSKEEMLTATELLDNVIFEGFLP